MKFNGNVLINFTLRKTAMQNKVKENKPKPKFFPQMILFIFLYKAFEKSKICHKSPM